MHAKIVEGMDNLPSFVLPVMIKINMKNMKLKKYKINMGKIITGILIVRVEGDGNVIRNHSVRNIRKIENMLI